MDRSSRFQIPSRSNRFFATAARVIRSERHQMSSVEVGVDVGDRPVYISVAAFAYQPPDSEEHESDLHFDQGEEIEVLADKVEVLGDGWSLGRVREPHGSIRRTGFFPSAYARRRIETLDTSANDMIDEAAVRVQSVHRGKAARRRLRAQREREAAAGNAEVARMYWGAKVASARAPAPSELSVSALTDGSTDDGPNTPGGTPRCWPVPQQFNGATQVLYKAVAAYTYNPGDSVEHANDLTFAEGEILDVLSDSFTDLGDGWGVARRMLPGGRTHVGFFPLAYVQPQPESAWPIPPEFARESGSAAVPVYVAKAMYSYVPDASADHQNDLAFSEGDELEVLTDCYGCVSI